MATSKKAAPAAKTPAAKPAPAPVKKAAPAPAPAVEEAEEGVELEVGMNVRFLGYGEDVPEDQQVMVAGEVYPVVGFTEASEDGTDPGGNPILEIPNPSFNPKKKENPDTNPKLMSVEAMVEEIEPADDVEEATEEATEEEVAEEVAAPAPAPAKKTAVKKAEVKEPAKPAAKKAATKAAPAKKAATKKVAEPVEEKDPDAVPDLENEDADVLELVNSGKDLVEIAMDLDSESEATQYRLGGILYHIKKDKLHHKLTDEAGNPLVEYQERGGFDKFVQEHFAIGYRQAMNLIEVYIFFNQAGIEDAAARVARIGVTKAAKIARHLVGENAKPEELLELAETNTVADLTEVIKETVTVGAAKVGGEKKKRITFKFRLFEEEGASVNAILEAAKEQLGLKGLEDALVHVVQEWAADHANAQPTKAAAPKQTAAPARKPVRAAAAV